MTLFYLGHQRRFPIYYYFGIADTVVVSSLALTAKCLDHFAAEPWFAKEFTFSQYQLDWFFVPMQLVILCVAIKKIIENRSLTGQADGVPQIEPN